MGRQIAELNENMSVVKEFFLDGQTVNSPAWPTGA
jgi:hypothetical protein